MYLKHLSLTLAIVASLLLLSGGSEAQAGDSPIKVKPLTYRADTSDVRTENVGFGFYSGRHYRRSYYGGYGYGRYYGGFGYRGFYGGYYRPYGFYRPYYSYYRPYYSYYRPYYGYYGYRYPFAYRAAYPYYYSVGYYGPRYSLYNTYYTRPYYVSTLSTAYVAPTFSTCCSVPVVRQTCNYGYTCAPLNCCQPVCGCDGSVSSGPVINNNTQKLPELAPEQPQNSEPTPPKPEAEQPTPPQPAEGVET